MTVLSLHCFFVSGGQKLEISVWIYPGDTVLHLAKPVHSTAKLLPTPDTVSTFTSQYIGDNVQK